MSSDRKPADLPPIPAKRYFTIGEVSELCAVKPHVLRYWESEFTQLRPMKRRGNRRYYQRHEVLLVRRIRELLYAEGFTISGARLQLSIGAAGAGSEENANTRKSSAAMQQDSAESNSQPAEQNESQAKSDAAPAESSINTVAQGNAITPIDLFNKQEKQLLEQLLNQVKNELVDILSITRPR